ncbi:MAG: type II toxin-antitoxin system mRNA interferase toxin, RelE/StbE family [Thioploca sp.]|nr:type II toxin-antitoxin system mRNA interferase toxin, RelE/StbE family [Thioploca sp.]
MTRVLLESSTFLKALQRILKREPQLADRLRIILQLLAEDAFQPQLKTHKLKGKLAGTWACSVGHDLRIIFELVEFKGNPAILLLTIGTHDEVY